MCSEKFSTLANVRSITIMEDSNNDRLKFKVCKKQICNWKINKRYCAGLEFTLHTYYNVTILTSHAWHMGDQLQNNLILCMAAAK